MQQVFLVNFGIGNGLLSRKRLATLELRHFPQMNITNYEHQLCLMEHIRNALAFPFRSPGRHQALLEMHERMSSRGGLFSPKKVRFVYYRILCHRANVSVTSLN